MSHIYTSQFDRAHERERERERERESMYVRVREIERARTRERAREGVSVRARERARERETERKRTRETEKGCGGERQRARERAITLAIEHSAQVCEACVARQQGLAVGFYCVVLLRAHQHVDHGYLHTHNTSISMYASIRVSYKDTRRPRQCEDQDNVQYV